MNYSPSFIIALFVLSCPAHAAQTRAENSLKAAHLWRICGIDDRLPFQGGPYARILKTLESEGGCTGTLVSSSCLVTAGHCAPNSKFAEFNVPLSNPVTGKTAHPLATDQYEVEQVIGSYDFIPDTPDRTGDWAVLRLKKNTITGMPAGQVQGYLKYRATTIAEVLTSQIQMTGFGASEEKSKNFSEQRSLGTMSAGRNGYTLTHTVSVSPGNSGSAVVLTDTEEVIGVHNAGGCVRTDNHNSGTLIGEVWAFQNAIERCLDLDR